ncbi:urease accessory protein UreD [Mycobacterium sp. E2462]|uniref:urease accessory protein UreD n=1 Tax=Mycobacterium sp. E2462 TaxID=1834133 RepID=UPI0008001534|nr:urease accessory protein UreD [Mycobacterium sp. E2462]OBI10313.1 urease accessory protein UreD [Mycobacterium sp. E2462]
MRSRVEVVASRDRLPRVRCTGGVAARYTGFDTVHLVSAAATPLGGDTIDIRVIVEPGAGLALRSAAATVALPGPDTPTSRMLWAIENAGSLDIDLEPTVVAADARHLSCATVSLGDQARLRFRERVQIGRCGERQGFWSGSMTADCARHPVLRHRLELGPGSLTDDALGAPRATISEFRYPATAFDASPLLDGATTLCLAGGGLLSTWQAERLAG